MWLFDVLSVKKQLQASPRGLVIVYTGEGKGKTTAALGLALRAAGYKKRVLIVQFGKVWFTGELEGIKKLHPYVKIVQKGKGWVKLFNDQLTMKEHRQAAREALEYLSQEVSSGRWDIIIADEIVGAVAAKLLTLKDVLYLINKKPEQMDLVLTGHHASSRLIAKADLVTEMVPIKHPYQKGILAKASIDF